MTILGLYQCVMFIYSDDVYLCRSEHCPSMVINLLLFSSYLKKSDPVHVATYKPNRNQTISDQFVRLEIYTFIDILSHLPKVLKI